MRTRQDRSRKVCWSIVVPDRWHPKINTTWRSLRRARTTERAERLANAMLLRLNRDSWYSSSPTGQEQLGDVRAATGDCLLSRPFTHTVAAKGRAQLPENPATDGDCRLLRPSGEDYRACVLVKSAIVAVDMRREPL